MAAPRTGSGPIPASVVPESRTLVVGKGGKGQCMSLRVALRQAEPGMKILVLPGVYRESLVVDKDVAIVGQGDVSEVVLESPKGSCLVLQASDVRIQGLTIQGAQGDPEPVLAAVRGRVLVEGCDLDASGGPGLLIAGNAADPVLRTCALRGSGPAAVSWSRTPSCAWRTASFPGISGWACGWPAGPGCS
jgi:hypothetical protein